MHRQAEAPVFGGDMGYVGPEAHFSQNVPRTGDAGTYVPKSVLDAGEADGVALEYYKSYDTRALEGLVGSLFGTRARQPVSTLVLNGVSVAYGGRSSSCCNRGMDSQVGISHGNTMTT